MSSATKTAFHLLATIVSICLRLSEADSTADKGRAQGNAEDKIVAVDVAAPEPILDAQVF